jgi:hypothetical protein
LVEVFLPRIESKEEFMRILKLAFEFAKTVTLGTLHWDLTDEIVARNRRIGTSVSGVVDFIAQHGVETLIDWLDSGYKMLRAFDRDLSARWKVNPSVKITSVKPSGTVSLLPGVSPGIHFPHAKYYYRRVQCPANSELIKPLKEAGYYMEPLHIGKDEDGEPVLDYNTLSVRFPMCNSEHTKLTKNDVDIEDQLKLTAIMQKYWCDNQVSVTISFDPETEGPALADTLLKYYKSLKCLSLNPQSKKDGKTNHPQSPYETITKSEYEAESGKILRKRPIWDMAEPTTPMDMMEEEKDTRCDADGGACSWDRAAAMKKKKKEEVAVPAALTEEDQRSTTAKTPSDDDATDDIEIFEIEEIDIETLEVETDMGCDASGGACELSAERIAKMKAALGGKKRSREESASTDENPQPADDQQEESSAKKPKVDAAASE